MINLINTQPGQTASFAQERVNFESLVGKIPQSQSSAPLRSEPRSIPAVLISVSPSEDSQGSGTVIEPGSGVTDSNRLFSASEERNQRPESPSTRLSESELAMVKELSARDREVKAHEMAHKAAAGSVAGAMSFDYQRGPDGRMYAVGGEVSIRTSTGSSDPQERLDRAEQVLRAATAPAEPSQQDLKVAAQARAEIESARVELSAQRVEQQSDRTEGERASGSDESQNEESRLGADQRSERESEKEKVDYFAELQDKKAKTASELQAYQAKLIDIQEQIAEVNQKLTELGVLEQLYSNDSPVGRLVDETT